MTRHFRILHERSDLPWRLGVTTTRGTCGLGIYIALLRLDFKVYIVACHCASRAGSFEYPCCYAGWLLVMPGTSSGVESTFIDVEVSKLQQTAPQITTHAGAAPPDCTTHCNASLVPLQGQQRMTGSSRWSQFKAIMLILVIVLAAPAMHRVAEKKKNAQNTRVTCCGVCRWS